MVEFRILYNDKVCNFYDSLSAVFNSKMYDTKLGMLPGLGDKGMQNIG
jgi:hypothetical protein